MAARVTLRTANLAPARRLFPRRRLPLSTRPLGTMPSFASPIAKYNDAVSEGALRADGCQERVVKKMDRLHQLVAGYKPPSVLEEMRLEEVRLQQKGHGEQSHEGGLAPSEAVAEPEDPVHYMIPKGLYVWGEVGTGKSMLMDLFYNCANVEKKRRVHFHQFMLEVHVRIRDKKREFLERYGRNVHIELLPERDAIALVAAEIAAEAWVLCFDEFQVTDIADALIMRKLFDVLFSKGTIVVCTSNRPPRDLYQSGINREYFLPFIDVLRSRCAVVSMRSELDHRQLATALAGFEQFLFPLNSTNEEKLLTAFKRMTGSSLPTFHSIIPVMMGRELTVPVSSKGVCWFTFADLCEKEKGAADYVSITGHFHTVILQNIPKLSSARHDRAKRFITLVDELYEHKTRLICSCEVGVFDLFMDLTLVEDEKKDFDEPRKNMNGMVTNWQKDSELSKGRFALLPGGDPDDPLIEDLRVSEAAIASVKELSFAFKRARSRIIEMGSEEYVEAHLVVNKDLYEFHGGGAEQFL